MKVISTLYGVTGSVGQQIYKAYILVYLYSSLTKAVQAHPNCYPTTLSYTRSVPTTIQTLITPCDVFSYPLLTSVRDLYHHPASHNGFHLAVVWTFVAAKILLQRREWVPSLGTS